MKLDASIKIRDLIDDFYRSDSRRVFASLVRLLKDLIWRTMPCINPKNRDAAALRCNSWFAFS